jgi:sulfonate transport system substrate-binding protein
VKGEPRVRLYSSARETFRALAQLETEGKAARVTFVHDRLSGNKLFADKVWYVQSENDLSAFLLKASAEDWAKGHAGQVIPFEAARQVAAAR